MEKARQVDDVAWRKSSYSSANGNCVEVANASSTVGVRDSKAPTAGHLTLPPTSWGRFLDQVK